MNSLPLSSSSLNDLNSNSNSLFENTENMNSDLFLSDNNLNSGSSALIGDDSNQSFELADCSSSSSMFPPLTSKFRYVKRIDGSPQSCENTGSKTGGGDNSISFPPALMMEPFEILESLERSFDKNPAREELKHNSVCVELTLGVLPWGACSNPDPRETTPVVTSEPYPWLGGIKLWSLDYCMLRESQLLYS